jgi:hypothetical protein
MNLQGRSSMDRWLGDAGRGATGRSGGRTFRLPQVRTWVIGVGRCCGVEGDGRQHARAPLRLEQRLQLQACPFGVVPGTADRDKGRVPAPLVGIEHLRGPRIATRPIPVEDIAGRVQKVSGGGTARGAVGRFVGQHGTSIHSTVQVSITCSPAVPALACPGPIRRRHSPRARAVRFRR